MALAAEGEGGAGSQTGEHDVDALAAHRNGQEEPWTFQQLISVMSGLVGSLLSLTAFNQQRKATKNPRSQDNAARSDGGSRSGARIVQQLGGSLLDAEAESPLFSLGPIPRCTAVSDLRRPGRHFTIITTAALPWLTGTAVNPLLRALALARMGKPVVLVLPWLEEDDQPNVFGKGVSFSSTAEQEKVIEKWCKERAKVDISSLPLQFRWYKALYNKFVCSIFPQGDCSQKLGADDPRDVLILEEPEHLCWYHHGQRWPTLFNHVIGIVHTNYQDYVSRQRDEVGGTNVPDEIKEASVFAASTVVCSAYCDVNIKLSDTIMPLPNEVTCNCHGVRDEFLLVGDRQGDKAKPAPVPSGQEPPATAYYLGKALYEKGWRELLDVLEAAGSKLEGVRLDGWGSGPDSDGIIAKADALRGTGVSLKMHPGIDHANEAIHGYGVLVNPSTTDVLCTVTVEALAMGKRVVLARHPSNRFFEEYFPDRCFFFRAGDVDEFVQALQTAIAAGPPQPLPPETRRILTWEAATERLFDAAEVRVLSGPYQRPSDAAASRLAYRLHFELYDETPVLGSLIKEATLGEKTPWDEYLSEFRRTQMSKLRTQAEEFKMRLRQPPDHIQEHEQYLRERFEDMKEAITRGKSG